MTRTWYWLGAVLLSAGLVACGGDDDTTDLVSDDGGSGGMDASATDGSAVEDGGMSVPADGSPFRTGDGGVVLCPDGEACICSNGIDDDEDGLIDGLDPECTGPYDDDESSFATGIPGDNRDPNCQDCFFDGNSGSGDDKCRYATSCLEDGTPTSGSGSCMTCEATAECVDNCRPRTPNGCDCYGCCEVYVDGEPEFVQLGTECSLANIDDETACPRCMQATDCVNDCGRCELCAGKTEADLPEDCNEVPDGGAPTPGYTCDDGEQVCGEEAGACPEGFYCQLGCCLEILI